MIRELAAAQAHVEQHLPRLLTPDEGDRFRTSIRAAHLGNLRIADNAEMAILSVGRPLTAAEILARLQGATLSQSACCTTGQTPAALNQQLQATMHGAARSGAVIHVHTWSRWDRVRLVLPWLLIGILLGALSTTCVDAYLTSQRNALPVEAGR